MKSKSMDVDDIMKVIHSTKVYDGQFNRFRFNSYGDGKRGYGLYISEDGNYKLLDDGLGFD